MRRDGFTTVLDSNAYRPRPGAPDLLSVAMANALARGGRIVVPDAVLLEQGKNEHWRETYGSTFAEARRSPRLFASSIQRSQGLAFELKHGRPVDGIVHADSTLIVALAGGDPAVADAAAARIDQARQQCATRLDGARAQRTMAYVIGRWKDILDAGDLLKLRRGELSPARVLARPGFSLALAGQESSPFTRDVAYDLLTKRSFLASTHFTTWAAGLRWLIRSGFDGLSLEAHANEAIDLEIIELGLLSDEFVTREKRMIEVFKIAQGAMRRWERRVRLSARWHGGALPTH